MPHIKSVKLENCFQHRKFTGEFSPFTMIIGQNGSGKSNLIEAIRHNANGTFLLPGNNVTMITDGEESGKSTVVYESDGVEYTSVAHLGKSNRSLSSPVLETKFTKASEALDYLRDAVFRTPADVMNESAILQQGHLDEGLFATPMVRAQAFTRLAGLHNLESMRRLLDTECSKYTVSTVLGDIEALKLKRADLLKKIEDTKAAQVKLQEKVTAGAADYAVHKEAVVAHGLIQQSDLTMDKADATLAALYEIEGEANQRIATLTSSLAAKQAWVNEHAGETNQLRGVLAAHAEAERAWAAYQQNLTAITAAEAELSQLVEPDSTQYAKAAALIIQSTALVAEAASAVQVNTNHLRIWEGLKRENRCACPTCSAVITPELIEQTIEAYTGHLARAQAKHSAAAAENTALQQVISAHQLAVSTYTSKKSNLESRISAIRSSLREAVQPASAADVVQRIAEYDAVVSAVAKETTALTSMQQTLVKAQSQITATKEKKEELVRLFSVLNPTFDVERAKYLVEGHEKKVSELAASGGAIEALEAEIAARDAEITATAEKAEVFRRVMDYANNLAFARNILHVNKFPAAKVTRFIERMLVSANSYLETMASGFSVTYEEADGFKAWFPLESKYTRGDRLSGGERVVFSLAFRFAVNELCSSTGFLILDEPTVYLDDAHVGYVLNALMQVRRRLTPRVQIIVVTHDERLLSAAESVIRIG